MIVTKEQRRIRLFEWKPAADGKPGGKCEKQVTRTKFHEYAAEKLTDDKFGQTNQAVFREAFCASDIWRFTAEIKEDTYTDAVEQLRGGVEINFGQSCVWKIDPKDGSTEQCKKVTDDKGAVCFSCGEAS